MDWLGWCANYVRTAFNVSKKIARAWWVWEQSPSQHTDRDFPVGVYFPLYFRYTRKLDNSGDNEWGHTVIAYVYPNGSMTIDSSPISRKPYADTWSSIAQVEQKYSSSYVGWSEHVNGTRVIQYIADSTSTPQGGDDMAKIDSSAPNWQGRAARSFETIRGRGMAQSELDAFNGQDFLHLVEALEDDAEADQHMANANVGAQALAENWQGQIAQYQQTATQLNDTISSVTADDNATKAELQDALSKVATLTTELKTATDQATSTPAPVKTVVPDPATYYSFSQLFKAIVQNVTNWLKNK